MSDQTIWKTKLAARIHDPAEKALVLLRDPAGHEGGTSLALKRLLGLDQLPEHIDPDSDDVLSTVIFKNGLPSDIYRHVQRADWWAAAADRPQWPMEERHVTNRKGDEVSLRIAPWAQVSWTKEPVLVHPLAGEEYTLPGGLGETDIDEFKTRSFNHFSELLVRLGAGGDQPQDLRKTLLTYWRFGPDLSVTHADTDDFHKLGPLWSMLPADTRVPDHSIWDHLDLTSAFAGAFAADPDGEAALLALSIGPVQGFISAARKMDDLWAGSHLLSRLSWEVMRPLCEELGPDAILFPRLRGIPQVDLWLRDKMDLPAELFENCEWQRGTTDANPLFSAALPNRFVAVVPAAQAEELAARATSAVRSWLDKLGEDVVERLLAMAGEESGVPYEQMRKQLKGFPEVHWAAVPFSLIHPRNKQRQTNLDTTRLSEAMAPFFGAEASENSGFLDSPAWKVLGEEIQWQDNTTFFAPNPGVLYPAVYDLAERVMAAAKATRSFEQTQQQGWRDSLTGEAEWLTTDRDQLTIPPGQRKNTLWSRVAEEKPAWAKKGEHLAALPAIKRLWPTLFAEEVEVALGWKNIGRFVVSTHTMALAHQLDQWLVDGGHTKEGFANKAQNVESVALPRRLMLRHGANAALADAKRLPALLDQADEADSEDKLRHIRQLVRKTLGVSRVETYYGFLMMDGDSMGAILSGDESNSISYLKSFHPSVRKGFEEHARREPAVAKYGKQKRAISPNRHLAISGALNDFSQTVVRHIVEGEYLGRLIYAGGDDVLATLPVADLLPAMQRLRHAYSGDDPEYDPDGEKTRTPDGGVLALTKGFAGLEKRGRLQLMRMMGTKASASCGAVIAHHQAPLSAVMRELRAAERRAKQVDGKDAFSLTVIKRSGGALYLSEHWGEPVHLLLELTDFLRSEGTSRRAAYHTQVWLKDLPVPKADNHDMLQDMLRHLLEYQMARQTSDDRQKARVPGLADRLVKRALKQPAGGGLGWLDNFLSVAEFLARETRSGGQA
ncbi:MAG TPA: type III-B CRISPR-associated protein Cas10/Cmr2 [Wenzhouxiangella sp.]|nr:type III-B CRISPR-associated protein Cas10/Cmr2 [Wenzhouxiangella sp.]